jgi:hypothetical protein
LIPRDPLATIRFRYRELRVKRLQRPPCEATEASVKLPRRIWDTASEAGFMKPISPVKLRPARSGACFWSTLTSPAWPEKFAAL